MLGSLDAPLGLQANQASGKRRGEVRVAEPVRAALLCGSKVLSKIPGLHQLSLEEFEG